MIQIVDKLKDDLTNANLITSGRFKEEVLKLIKWIVYYEGTSCQIKQPREIPDMKNLICHKFFVKSLKPL